ncbi:MAG: hypothetical protein Fur0032_01660 [Terrimicrobiaceae bacterium]
MKDFLIEKCLLGKAARLDDLVEWMRPRIDPTKKRILLAAAPKSASTYLTKLLGAALGWKIRDAVGLYGSSEQQIYLPRLVGAMRDNTLIGQQHLRANEFTLNVLRLFHFKTIVLVRDFEDSAVSIRDHHLRESTVHSMAAADEAQIRGLSDTEHLWFVIRMVMPWYFNFYVSWQKASRQSDLPIHWLNYSELIADPAATLTRLVAFIGVDRSPSQIDAAIEAASSGSHRKNVGISGRGQSQLNNEQRAALREMAAFYPDIDFSPVGLGPEGAQP